MTTYIIIWLVANIFSLVVIGFAIHDAWKDYIIALHVGGWRILSARALLRAQIYRMVKVCLLLSVPILVSIWPDSDVRPEGVSTIIRMSLTSVVVLMALSAYLDVDSKRKIIKARE